MIPQPERTSPFVRLDFALTLAAVWLAVSLQAGQPATRSATPSPATGNLTLLVPVDSSNAEERARVDRTLLCALEHFGMPFQLLDLAEENLTAEVLQAHPAVVLAQAGLGGRLSDHDIRVIAEAVNSGVGLVNFDGSLSTYPAAYLKLLGVASTNAASATALRIANPSHPITAGTEPERPYELVQPVEVADVGHEADVLLRTDRGLPAAFTERLGRGRVVQFTLPAKFWLPEYFGHVHGLDGVFWKSLVWAARKPFVMLAMPPFVTAQIDDASGSGSKFLINPDSSAKSFRYIDSLNRRGYLPSVSLFIDDIQAEDVPIVKRKFDSGLTEFSAHAWTETRFIYIDRVRSHNQTRMEEFTSADLQQRFAKLDGKFAHWGIKPAKTLNPHCFSPGVNSLPFLKERGEIFILFAGRFGKNYYDPSAFDWNPKPYGHPGFTFDYMPEHPEFFTIQSHPYRVSPEGKISDMDIDILAGNTTFGKECATNRLEAAAQKAAEGLRLGLDSLFFGCFMTHEQRIASLTVDEWESILHRVEKLISKRDWIFKNQDYISEYAKSRYDTKILAASCERPSGKIRLKLVGKPTLPLKLYRFSGDSLGYKFREVPAFQGEQSVVLD